MVRHSLHAQNRRGYYEDPYECVLTQAENLIADFPQDILPTPAQLGALATAHYTLALREDIPLCRALMHVNSAILLFKALNNTNPGTISKLSIAYYKRAEMFELEGNYIAAAEDYQHAINMLDKMKDLSKQNILLMAQCAISIADLLINEQISPSPLLNTHPLFYVNKALGKLSQIPYHNDETWNTVAYAHYIAGLTLSQHDIIESLEAFRTGIASASRSKDSEAACHLIGDIYNSMGLLFEDYFFRCPIQKVPTCLQDNALIYFGIATLYQPTDLYENDEITALEIIFEAIYRALDPYLAPLSGTVLRDFIDALLYAYYCITHKTLPNELLIYQLQNPDTLKSYVQHIYWLVEKFFLRENIDARLLALAEPKNVDLSVDLNHIFEIMHDKRLNNIHYLKKTNVFQIVN